MWGECPGYLESNTLRLIILLEAPLIVLLGMIFRVRKHQKSKNQSWWQLLDQVKFSEITKPSTTRALTNFLLSVTVLLENCSKLIVMNFRKRSIPRQRYINQSCSRVLTNVFYTPHRLHLHFNSCNREAGKTRAVRARSWPRNHLTP